MNAILRFAPSPNGRLHLGHAYSALLNQCIAAQLGGRLLLRIEDIDPVRSRPELARGIVADLDWLGLRFADGPLHQSTRIAVYAQFLTSLAERGLAYPCFCSRRQAATAADPCGPRDPDGVRLYPGTCRALPVSEARARRAASQAHTWRLDMARALTVEPGPHSFQTFTPGSASASAMQAVAAEPGRWGDAIIARRDVLTSYHLSVVVDDDAQGISHVVRGADLRAATDLHVLLQALLGLARPAYHHHRLIQAENGEKLAKSRGAPALADMRARGLGPDDIRRQLAPLFAAKECEP